MSGRFPTYLIFQTEAAANAAEQSIAKARGFGGPGRTTQRWCKPRELTDGRWAIISPNPNEGVDRLSVKTKAERAAELLGELPFRPITVRP